MPHWRRRSGRRAAWYCPTAPPPRGGDGEGDTLWWEASRTMAGSLPRMGKASKQAIRDRILAQAEEDSAPVPAGKALQKAEAKARAAIVTEVVAGADLVATAISTILSSVLVGAASIHVEPARDDAPESTGHRDSRADRAARQDAGEGRQAPRPNLPAGCWPHIQRQPGPLLRHRMRHATWWGPTAEQTATARAAWEGLDETTRRREAEIAAMRSLPRVAEGRPAVELTDLSDDDLMELDGEGPGGAQAADGTAQPAEATLLPHGTEGEALEPAPVADDGGGGAAAGATAVGEGEPTVSGGEAPPPTATLPSRKRAATNDAAHRKASQKRRKGYM